MEEKKYVCIVTKGVVGVDDKREVGRFDELADAIKFMHKYRLLLTDEAQRESQQVHYRNDKEFTQFDIQIEKWLLDEDDCFVDARVIAYENTPKFRYGQIVD